MGWRPPPSVTARISATTRIQPYGGKWFRIQIIALGRRCPSYDECFFYQARKEIEDADILIVNHHLYFSDLALRDDHAAILPAHDVVIFDEAHSLEDVATDHMGLSITDAQIRWFLDSLWSSKGKGILADQPWGNARNRWSTPVKQQKNFGAPWPPTAFKRGMIQFSEFTLPMPLKIPSPDNSMNWPNYYA